MVSPTTLDDTELSPVSGKRYFNITREWREEFIYFLMTGRFHDIQTRVALSQSGRSADFNTPDDSTEEPSAA